MEKIKVRLDALELTNERAFDAERVAQGVAVEISAAEAVRSIARIARMREALRNIQGLTHHDHDKSVFREASDALIEDGSDVPTLHCIKCGALLSCGVCPSRTHAKS